MFKKSVSMLLVLLVALSVALPVFAESAPSMDVQTQPDAVTQRGAIPDRADLSEVADQGAAALSAEENEALLEQTGAGTGWASNGNYWYYYENDVLVKGWKVIDGQTYFFHSTDGYMLTGGWKINGVPYFFDYNTGMLRYGWIFDSEDNYWNYADGNGVLLDGWQEIGGNWYYFYNYGMLTDFYIINGTEYYFGDDGCMRIGWFIYNNGEANFWMYANAGGGIQYDWALINGQWFFFDRETAFMLVGGWYIDDNQYYFASSGAMVTGWFTMGEHWYFALDSGVVANGWFLINGVWYYFAEEYYGLMLYNGVFKINGNLYAFAPSGAMVTGWYQANEDWYYGFDSGILATGTVEVPGYGVCIFSETGVFQGYAS